jgi:hypothetical protein
VLSLFSSDGSEFSSAAAATFRTLLTDVLQISGSRSPLTQLGPQSNQPFFFSFSPKMKKKK